MPSGCRTYARPARGVSRRRRPPFVAGYEAGLAEPVHALQRVVPLRRAGPCRRPWGGRRALDRALRARRRTGRSTPRRARSRRPEGPVVHAGDARTGPVLDRVAFPLGAMTKAEVRTEASAAGLDAARRPESQEACFLAGGDYRSFLSRHGVASRPGPIVDEAGDVVGRHDGLWRFYLGQRRGIGVASSEPLYALRSNVEANALVVGPRPALRVTRVDARGELYIPSRTSVKLRYRSEPVAGVTPRDAGFAPRAGRVGRGGRAGQIAVLYDGDAVVGAGVIERATGRIRRDDGRVLRRNVTPPTGPKDLPRPPRRRLDLRPLQARAAIRTSHSFVKGSMERDVLPVVVKTGGTVDPRQLPARQAGQLVRDSAVSMADSADTAVRAVSTAIATPVEKVSGLAAGVVHGLRPSAQDTGLLRGEGGCTGRRTPGASRILRRISGAVGRTAFGADKPTPTPTPPPQPKPDPWPRRQRRSRILRRSRPTRCPKRRWPSRRGDGARIERRAGPLGAGPGVSARATPRRRPTRARPTRSQSRLECVTLPSVAPPIA